MRRRKGLPNADHVRAAKTLRECAGEWRLVTTYPASYSASSAAYDIRTGRLAVYGPPGAFEAKTAQVSAGTAVYARYVGGGETP